MFRGLSPLEEGGFEPSVPRVDTLWFRAPRRSPGGLMVVEIPVKTDRLNRARLSRGYGSTGLAARNLFEFCNDLQRWGLGSALLRWLGVARSIFSEPREYPTVEPQCLHRPKPSSRGANVNDRERDSQIHHVRVVEVRIHLPPAESRLRTRFLQRRARELNFIRKPVKHFACI